ncbi:DUF6924 domain-containing protein [Streptomyces olivaceus]|uniref:DUF6924 domain-containing protein n=1 Tax=Streptomyces olivaceus TaxID=47716 RepID=UPI0036C07DD6
MDGEEMGGAKVGVRPAIGDHDAEAVLIVRTFYENEPIWQAILAELRQPWGENDEFETRLHIVDDLAWSGATAGEVLAAVRAAEAGRYFYIVDSTAVRHSHFAMLAVEIAQEADPLSGTTREVARTKDTFRLEPAAVGEVHMLLSLGERGFGEYVDEANRDSSGIVWSAF